MSTSCPAFVWIDQGAWVVWLAMLRVPIFCPVTPVRTDIVPSYAVMLSTSKWLFGPSAAVTGPSVLETTWRVVETVCPSHVLGNLSSSGVWETALAAPLLATMSPQPGASRAGWPAADV